MAISTTLFLFIHTRDLHTKLKAMEVKLQPEDMLSGDSAAGVGGGSGNTAVSAMVRILTQSDELESLDAQELNNTRHAGVDVVFFNRVPKVGSQTFMELLRRLSMRNIFGFHRDHIQRVETIRLAPSDQLNLATHVISYKPPAVYVKHVCFTNFTQYGLPEPIYVNLVRDPVERVISWYYYVRAPWYYVERKQAFPDIPLPDPHWLKKDFETCVLQGDRECRYLEGESHEGIGDHRRQSLFFCGHSDFCTPFNTLGALQRAKKAVERHYAVVGVLEDLNSTLTVLENYIPLFFKGATQVYWDEVDRFTRINRNLFKPPVSEEVKDIVRQNFTREVEFYQFCRQRLHRQLLALRLPSTHSGA
ncbi:heparan sulfate 2-O-sulfotransferase pipe isoform X2 [Zootermopsis nevadensis]|uniref:Heparan sulfate 2-O-sulfotransferase pipe n=2 Tax=Zootermopsis nevadensis TaxID=136037 RepID=A0A067R7J8_ZOONE|nr:heparan sulfate 2-O-sulfotransferase pipe isoform X2 [Zootermopsis nevadensis]XP_021920072.1 heparan sulfate 2-O-sulfotransferase pipe isoform X2 [Zootermopsis nevadensis]XP_021920073.1 heparan sulfate 2-O-sulfotransferase pipe isoform X2 [Zootermopsis nevadensis]XP_021920074.1 heparan sulfate 2-O-sulfotransferase pipe isoform X2 [Zootermopsis nevadensis]KDR19341.1 Heparan sulfate 2-O-sulfotransferase pipe [Zootermopsis nevadensis]